MFEVKKNLGQFYTKNAEYITQKLLNFIPQEVEVVDPFAGEWDLLNLVSDRNILAYDKDPKNKRTIKMDTLMNSVDYRNSWVFTNPPYLARNKNDDKEIYDKYETDDLYKAAILSIIGCAGGTIIIPLNFFSSEDDNIRTKFLSKYKVLRVNVFEEQVFDDTSYTVCSFSFVREKNIQQEIDFFFFPSGKKKTMKLKKEDGYRIGSEVYNLHKSSIKVGRLLIDEVPNSNIFLHTIDTGAVGGEIRLKINKEHYYGKNTDRAFASIIFSKKLPMDVQLYIVAEFNKRLKQYREKYRSLFLTNYRNSTKHIARKRIGFTLAYRIISNIIFELIGK